MTTAGRRSRPSKLCAVSVVATAVQASDLHWEQETYLWRGTSFGESLAEHEFDLIAHPLRLGLQALVVRQQLIWVVADLLRRVRILLVKVPVSRLDRVDAD